MRLKTFLLLTLIMVFFTGASCSQENLDTADKLIDGGKTLAKGAQSSGMDFGYGGIVTTVLSLAAGIVAFMRGRKHKATAENYREGIEAGIAEGEDKNVVSIPVLKEVLNKETKAHFNSEGVAKI